MVITAWPLVATRLIIVLLTDNSSLSSVSCSQFLAILVSNLPDLKGRDPTTFPLLGSLARLRTIILNPFGFYFRFCCLEINLAIWSKLVFVSGKKGMIWNTWNIPSQVSIVTSTPAKRAFSEIWMASSSRISFVPT